MENQKFEPAKRLKKPDGTVAYSWEGKLHNWEDAALIHPDGKKEYHLHGIKYTFEQWKEVRKNREGLPFYKNPAFKVRT